MGYSSAYAAVALDRLDLLLDALSSGVGVPGEYLGMLIGRHSSLVAFVKELADEITEPFNSDHLPVLQRRILRDLDAL